MLDQSFTTENFRRILDYENRRGTYLEGEFFPDVRKASEDLRDCMLLFRELKRQRPKLTSEQYKEQKSALNAKKQELSRRKEDLLTKELDALSSDIGRRDFSVGLKAKKVRGDTTAYVTERSAGAYFAMKHIQGAVRAVYKVKPSCAYDILCQLRGVLDNFFPKYVIRTDIEHFYDSIPQEKLVAKLNEDALLAPPVRRIINQILEEYCTLSGTKVGIPRGVGVSPYLAEIYMRRFDNSVRAHEDVIFYARFVDDIVVVFAPSSNSSVDQFLPFVRKQATGLSLTLSPTAKTQAYDVREAKKKEMDYLGYKITFGVRPIRIGISEKKIQKYLSRIRLSFEAYVNHAKYDEKRARKILVCRIQFLTGNTRLLHNKKNILIGSYFSNRLLSAPGELKPLDDYLRAQIDLLNLEPLKARLKGLSFETGFSKRRYFAFTSSELSKIVELWENET